MLASIFRAIKSSGADYDARVCEWLRDQAVGGKGEGGAGGGKGKGGKSGKRGLDRPPIQMYFCAFLMLPFLFCVYVLVLETWEPYLIIVADAADAVSVNFSGRCKFLQI